MTQRSSSHCSVALLFCAFLLVLAACGRDPLPPPGHVLLFFDTDAPVPPPIGERPKKGDPAPLVDRLIVEVFEPGSSEPCVGCRREFALDRGMLEEHRVSIQVPAASGVAGYRVRARLFLATHRVTGTEPPASGTITVVAALPAAPENGGIDHTLFLSTDDVGIPRGTLAEPTTTTAGPPAASKVGSWAGGRTASCDGPAEPGEACVPGGAFWMGRPGELSGVAETAADRPRLVVLSPHFLDENESTGADVRAFEKRTVGIFPWSGKTAGDSTTDYCTFSRTAGPRDSLPVNCILWPTARNYCLSKGKDLPTEAQFEHAAGALASRRFVWGDDPPACSDAVWGRGGVGVLLPVVAPCRSTAIGPACVGPACLGERARDVLPLEGGTLHDLAGNVSEWMLDRWNRQDEPCWVAGGVHRDPLCRTGGADALLMSVRSGSWLGDGRGLAASTRLGLGVRIPDPYTGMRCARPATPPACGPGKPGLYEGGTSGDEEGNILMFGIGCNGVISVVGAHPNLTIFSLVGTIDESGRIRLEGADVDAVRVAHTFVGTLDATGERATGTWSSDDGKKGTWRIFPLVR
jgi:formylglycine-generating enzyme required for sulfatase activity